jgi:Replication protein
VPVGPRYPTDLKELHTQMCFGAEGIPGLSETIRLGRMQNCAGFQSGCESRYCPACSIRHHYKLRRRLWNVVKDIPASSLRIGTFTMADCTDLSLRPIITFLNRCAQEMLSAIPSLQGWFLRWEASPAAPGYFHPHVHILMHVKAGYTSGRNTMSAAKWAKAWTQAIPEELWSTQRHPAFVESVRNLQSVVRYISKSPFQKANGRPNSFESDDERMMHRIEAAIHLNSLLTQTAKMQKYRSGGTLSLSGPSEPETE